MQRRILIIILFLLFANFAIADSLNSEIVNDQISPYDSATYRITISNEKNISDKYVISTGDVYWALQAEPLTDYTTGINVPAFSNYTATLLAKPRAQKPFVFGRKSFQVDFRSQATGRTYTIILSADVRQDLIKSPFDVDVTLVMPDVIDARQTGSIKVIVKNNNLLNISGLLVALQSNLFEKDATITILPEEEKVIDFPINLDHSILPQKDTATLTVSWKNTTVKTIKKDYSIGGYGSFSSESSVNESFLKRITTVKYTNDGNVAKTEKIIFGTEFFERLFTATNPSTVVENINGVDYFTANFTLEPGQSASLVVATDYMPLIYLLVILIALLILYLLFRAPIIIAKEAKDVVVDEGGIRGVSVTIKVKNRSARKVENVRVIEKVPNIAVVELRKSDVQRPDKTYHYAEGIVLQYDLHKMEPGEIRFITYHMKTKLGVVGDFRLKPVIAQYERGKKAYSNPVDVFSP